MEWPISPPWIILCACKAIPPPKEIDLWTNAMPTIIEGGIVLLLFLIGRLLDSAIRLREIRRSWYLKVIIDPNMPKLETFYSEVQSSVALSINTLVPQMTVLTFAQYLTSKSSEMGKFQALKRKFEFEFIKLVQTNYPEVANDLTDLLRGLEDRVTGTLDDPNLLISHIEELEPLINQNKHQLLDILYRPLVLTRNKLFSFFKF